MKYLSFLMFLGLVACSSSPPVKTNHYFFGIGMLCCERSMLSAASTLRCDGGPKGSVLIENPSNFIDTNEPCKE